jgi:hypothetical protein
MKQFYQNHLSSTLQRSVLLFALLVGACYLSGAQIYTAILSGAAESPANSSPGTGKGTVTITGTMMRVQANFSGLVAPVTASHIHAATAVPGVGTAGVATTVPTFTGFPSGVTAGTYDRVFDMTLASSYNPAYITANGGSPASAFAALKTAMDNGRSYLNIHSSTFPGGEIRGFLLICPTVNVSIPDAFALPQGVLPNTVYPAYAPASSLTLTTNVSGGTAPYTYSWSNGSTAATTTVSPTVNTTYSVMVLDQRICPGAASKTVNVVAIAGGKNGDKIVICHKGQNTLTIGASGVADHLGHGDMLGNCTEESITRRDIITEESTNDISVRVLRNPSLNYFDLQLGSKTGNNFQIKVYDLMGRVIETRSRLQGNQTLRLGSSYKPGIYLVEISQGAEKQILKLIKAD